MLSLEPLTHSIPQSVEGRELPLPHRVGIEQFAAP
jgi:hypothetical protein